MSAAAAAYLLPHPPIIVPAIGRGDLRRCLRTCRACVEIAARISALAPARVVLVSPHTPRLPRLPRASAVFATRRLAGTLARFGAPGIGVDLPNDLDLVHRLTAEASTFAALEDTLDHGALVPLWFLARAGWAGPAAVLGLPAWAGHDGIRRLGERLATVLDALPGTTVLVASGDMSHRVTSGAPAGYHPRAGPFDLACRDLIARGDLRGLLELDDALREDAAEDVIDPVLLVASAMGFVTRGAHVLSYEHPFGVGYLVAALHEDVVAAGSSPS